MLQNNTVRHRKILFVMDCKLGRVDSESGKYSSSRSSVLVQYTTSSSTRIGNVMCPSPSVLALIIMRMHKQWIPGPSFLGGSGLRMRLCEVQLGLLDCTFSITWYSICQMCSESLHNKNKLLIRMLLHLIHYCEFTAPRVYTFVLSI